MYRTPPAPLTPKQGSNSNGTSTSDAIAASVLSSLTDDFGPPVFLVPLTPSVLRATRSAQLHKMDHPVYDLLRSSFPEEQLSGMAPPTDAAAPLERTMKTMRAALIMRYSQPASVSPSSSTSSSPILAARPSIVPILSDALLPQCVLSVLHPEDQILRPPIGLFSAKALAVNPGAKLNFVEGELVYSDKFKCANSRFCFEADIKPTTTAAAAASPTTMTSPPLPTALHLIPRVPRTQVHKALAAASTFLRHQGHVSPHDGYSALRHQLELSPEHPAAQIAAEINAIKCSFDPDSDAIFLEEASTVGGSSTAGSTTGASSGASARAGVFDAATQTTAGSAKAFTGTLVQHQVGSIIDAAIAPLKDMVTNLFNGVLGGQFATVLGTSALPGAAQAIITDILRILPTHLQNKVPTSVAEIVKDQLPLPVAKAIAEHVTWTVTNRMTEHMMDHLVPDVADTTTRRVTMRIPKQIARSVTKRLAHMVTRSVTHAVVPALSQTLERSPLRYSWCEACREHGQLCQYCWQNARNLHAGFYYAGYYSTYYSDYYTKWFDQTLRHLAFEQRDYENHFERMRDQYKVTKTFN